MNMDSEIRNKKTRGFSYVEVIIALALFAIAMLAVIPVLSQAGRNLFFAMDAYDGHLQAQRTMLAVRGALVDGADITERIAQQAPGNFEYSVWVFGQHAREPIHSVSRPGANAAVEDIDIALHGHVSTIVVVIWCEDGLVIGRAIGMVYT